MIDIDKIYVPDEEIRKNKISVSVIPIAQERTAESPIFK